MAVLSNTFFEERVAQLFDLFRNWFA